MLDKASLEEQEAQLKSGVVVGKIVRDVLGDFHAQDISYCYWRSSRRLPEIFAGESDLDFFIPLADQQRAEMILLSRGFKYFPSVASAGHPSVHSFLAHDACCGKLFHVHAHFRLVVGEPVSKNYCLPWEQIVLERSIEHPDYGIRILDPEMEAALLVARACLELGRADPVILKNWSAVTEKFELDRRDLAGRMDPSQWRRLATRLFGENLGGDVCEALFAERPFHEQTLLKTRVRRHFRAFRCYGAVEARVRALARSAPRSWGWLNKRWLRLPRPWSRRALDGGRVITPVGGDGGGKTTILKTLQEWPSYELDTIPVYFGTGGGRPSLLLRPFKLLAPLVQRLLKSKPKGSSLGNVTSAPPALLYSVLLMVWAAVVATEKRAKLLLARRGANRGLIVIADRYPQYEIIGFNDGPLLSRLTNVPKWLRAYELAQQLPPDLVIRRLVTAEAAAIGEPEMGFEVIRRRLSELKKLQFSGAKIVEVNAERPLAQVMCVVKQQVWNQL